MRLLLYPFLLSFSLIFLSTPSFAAPPPTIVLNFASINELNWAAPEEEWQTDIKPKVVGHIRAMRTTLSPSPVEGTPVLAWSTLMEYMNFPMDSPSANSAYVIKMRRILEIAKEENFPVFVPFNGFQWWDELPELYNWWDPDGTKTDPAFFTRQDNPADFKRRFIVGYNPNNKYNVEWQSPTTPMKLGYRNWGGGGFRLAPAPYLLDHTHTPQTYRLVQRQRLQAIVSQIVSTWEQWKLEGKEQLLVGVSIGTEISLNASVTPADECVPYGYQSIAHMRGDTTLHEDDARIAVVQQYLEDNARLVTKFGIPNTMVYTHVLGEQDPEDTCFSGIVPAAFTYYARPGVSLYGYAKNPTGSREWMNFIKGSGNLKWGIMEYNAGGSRSDWEAGLPTAVQAAAVTVIYNWDGLSSQAVPVIKKVLSTPLAPNKIPSDCPVETVSYAQPGLFASPRFPMYAIESTDSLSHGIYTLFTQTTDCEGNVTYTTPKTEYVPVRLPPDTTPRWVNWILDNTRL